MDWAFKKRAIYLFGLLVILVIIFGLPIYRSLNKTPTCSDGRQNGNELGIDCGGVCSKICKFSAEPPTVLWSRSFEVRDGIYNSIAMIENPNIGSGAANVPYIFRLFDDKNILVYERKGRTDIPPQTRFPIFEGGIIAGERTPSRTFFEFSPDIDWFQKEIQTTSLKVINKKQTNMDIAPKIEANIENRGDTAVHDIDVFVIVYDLEDNALAVSKTFIEEILPDLSPKVVFTWPLPFDSIVGRVEILPKFKLER